MTTKTKKTNKIVANPRPIRYAFAPMLQQFRQHTRKNEARLWIPIETSLVSRYAFAALSPQTRYAFVAILLYCGANGIDEIPLDAKFMSSALIIDERTLRKSFEELLSNKLLQERIEREIRKDTDRQTERDDAGVSVEFENLSKTKDENQSQNGLLKKDSVATARNNNIIREPVQPINPSINPSMYSIDVCLEYVERCKTNGDTIQNAKALANHLHKTGEADSFIMATLYPDEVKAIERQTFGEPTKFSDVPCSVCFGAKMADADGKGFRPCEHCKDERGKSTGREKIKNVEPVQSKGEANNEA